MGFIDPNDFEAVALDTASEIGGAFLTEEKAKVIVNDKTMMVPLYSVVIEEWNQHQWKMLIETICAAYVQSLQDQQDQATRALQKVTQYPPV